MAIIKRGRLSGAVGPIVTYHVKGKEIVRSRPEKRTKQSPKQLSQQVRMKQTIEFLSGIRDVVRCSYPSEHPFSNGHVLARAAILRNAFAGIYPDLTFDFSKVPLSSAPECRIASISANYRDGWLDLEVELKGVTDKRGLSLVVVHEAGEATIQTFSYGPFPYSKENRYSLEVMRRESHGAVQHFWVMLCYPFRLEYMKSCYFSLSEEDPSPKTVYYSD
ncbi:DUF6266 family protein [Prolixibacteraceae bacterium]|nr:DUF6266 family protein [Prolixibacteraceae bacterium]